MPSSSMRGILSLVLGLSQVGLGLWLIVAPESFYATVPGVDETGPFNPHFVRDIGCAFFVAGGGLAWFALDRRARAAALAGAAFLSLHALMHIFDGLAGRESRTHLAHDLPLLIALAVAALWAAWPQNSNQLQENSMLKWFLRRRLDAFGRTYDYDVSYMREILDADPRALMAFNGVQSFAHYSRGVPKEVQLAAGLVSVMAEDCGPCTQLTIKMAEEAGVSPKVIEAIVVGRVASMSDDVVLAYRFAQAVLRHDPEADTLRAEIVRRWGERGLVSLAFAITAGRIFPTVKYAMGHGKACVRVQVGGKDLGLERQAA